MKEIPVFIHSREGEQVGALSMTDSLESLLTGLAKGGTPVAMAPSFLMDGGKARLIEISFVPHQTHHPRPHQEP